MDIRMDTTIDILESTRKAYCEPSFVEDLSEYGQIFHISCSPYEWSQDVILIAFKNVILLAHLNFEDKIIFNTLSKFLHPARCTALSLSPETSLALVPNQVIFCTGDDNFKIRIFSSDLQDNNTCKVLSGHTSYINDIMFDSENNYLASGSDDSTAKIWSTKDYKLLHSFQLTSPVVNVCWHRTENSKLLVAEKIGLLKLFNIEKGICVFSTDYGRPMVSAHWAPSDSQILASLHFGELLLWDLTKPCLPVHTNTLFPENGGKIKFSPHGELVAAVNNLDGTLKIVQVKNNSVKLTSAVTLPTNVQWHYRYPVVCLGDDNKLCFWKISK